MDHEENLLNTLRLLIQVLLVLDYAWRQAMADPGQKLLLGLPLKERKSGGQVFMNLRRHCYLQFMGQSVHKFAETVNIFAIFVLNSH